MSSTEEMARCIREWAEDEMQFVSQGYLSSAALPPTAELQQMCSGWRMLELWNFVTKFVKSAETVRKVRGNLFLDAKMESRGGSYKVRYKGKEKYSQEEASLQDHYERLQSQIAQERRDAATLQTEINRLEKEMSEAEQFQTQTCSQTKELRHSKALLHAYSKQCEAQGAQYKEYTARVQQLVEQFQKVSSRPIDNKPAYSQETGDGTSSGAVESACTHDVRLCTKELQAFLTGILQGQFGADKGHLSRRKEQLWTVVENVTREHPVNHVLHSLGLITQDATFHLRDVTARVDVENEVEQLSFDYVGPGQFRDVSSGPNVVKGVQQLLQEAQVSHFHQFIRTEQSLNAVWKERQALDEAKARLEKILSGKMLQAGVIELTKSLLGVELELAGAQAALQCLQESAGELETSARRRGTEKKALEEKHGRIQDFQTTVERKQDLIRVLTKQNSDSKPRLVTLQREWQQFMQRQLCIHESQVQANTLQLKGAVKQEVESLLPLKLSALKPALLDQPGLTQVRDLSLYAVDQETGTVEGTSLRKVAEDVNCKSYKAAECLLPQVIQMKVDIAAMATLLQSHDQLMEELQGVRQAGGLQRAAALCEEVARADRSMLERLLPQLEVRMDKTQQVMGRALRVRDYKDAWWDQPAQHLAPWLEQGGQTYRQWCTAWTVGGAHLHQARQQFQ
ncbi:HAUS augmin-like complex subunit 5 [Branchiostoma floridae x Branchiostoma belcheri]